MSLIIPSTTAMESPAPPTTNRTQLPFPPEIRVIIYKYVFASTTPFVRGQCTKSQRCRHHPECFADIFVSYPCANIHCALDLSLLLVSRDTYIETFHMYYSLNTIHLCSTELLYQFLTRIGYARRQQLVSVGFHEFGQDAKRAFLVLRTAERLEHIKFHLPNWCVRHGNYQIVPGLAALREVRGLSHVEITSSFDCSDLIAAMMRPRLARNTPKSKDDDKVDLFKQPKERFPKSEAQRLRIGMNWTFGTNFCDSCPKLAKGDIIQEGIRRITIPVPRPLDVVQANICLCWRQLGRGLHA